MWVWTLDWSEIRPDLVIGTCPVSLEDLARVRDEAGAAAVLSVQSDDCLAHFGIAYDEHRRWGEAHGLSMRRAPMRDFDVADQRRRLADAVRALGNLLHADRRVYLHCTAGLGRAPLVAVGYLTFVEGMSAEDAFALVKAQRPNAVPSPEALAGCREDLDEAGRAYRQRMRAGHRGDARSDWLEAEARVLRSLLGPGR